jgi:cyclophilin family peptidyl-prolyl cis-trans isomerase
MVKKLTPPVLVLALIAATGWAFAEESGPPEQKELEKEEVCVLETSMGTMVFRFFEEAAPLTVRNFKTLVREGFYDGKEFYRVVAGHVIQAGDGEGTERPTVKGEFGAHPHVVGAVGLARDEDPDSGSTEFYICHAARPHLDGRYAVFGLLVEGFDVLESIGNVEVEEVWLGEVAFHKPKEPVLIERAYLETRPLGKC